MPNWPKIVSLAQKKNRHFNYFYLFICFYFLFIFYFYFILFFFFLFFFIFLLYQNEFSTNEVHFSPVRILNAPSNMAAIRKIIGPSGIFLLNSCKIKQCHPLLTVRNSLFTYVPDTPKPEHGKWSSKR